MSAYTAIPSASKFKSDSSVLGATRANDSALTYIDQTLDHYGKVKEAEAKFTALADVFFGINSWVVALREKRPGVNQKRYDAIMKLLAVVEATMMKEIGVTNRGTLAHKLVEIFGSENNRDGQATDLQFNAKMMTMKEREVTRLHFASGKIYRFMIDKPGSSALQPLFSDKFQGRIIHRPGGAQMFKGFAPFVMSMEREFYMTEHAVAMGGAFHSAYFRGKPVGAAGTMLVENGILRAIRGDSGHYRPSNAQMAHALRALQAKGVNLTGVTLYHYLGAEATSAAVGSKANFAKPAPRPRLSASLSRQPARMSALRQSDMIYVGDAQPEYVDLRNVGVVVGNEDKYHTPVGSGPAPTGGGAYGGKYYTGNKYADGARYQPETGAADVYTPVRGGADDYTPVRVNALNFLTGNYR